MPWWRRWLGKANQGVIGAGALAAAVTGVWTMAHIADPSETGAFTSVTVTADVPFGEYKQRWTRPQPVAAGLPQLRLAAAAATPRMSTSTPADGRPAGTIRVSASAGTTASGEAGAPPASGSAPVSGPARAESPVPTGTTDDQPALRVAAQPVRLPQVFDQAGDAASVPPLYSIGVRPGGTPYAGSIPHPGEHGDCTGRQRFTRKACIWYDVFVTRNAAGSGPAETSAAGKAGSPPLQSQLQDFRTVRVKGAKAREPLGVVISVNVDLGGVRGKPVMLSWSLWQAGAGERLYEDWLNENLAYQLTAETDHDTAAGDFWIPLPAEKGSYFIRARLSRDDTTLATADSPTFR